MPSRTKRPKLLQSVPPHQRLARLTAFTVLLFILSAILLIAAVSIAIVAVRYPPDPTADLPLDVDFRIVLLALGATVIFALGIAAAIIAAELRVGVQVLSTRTTDLPTRLPATRRARQLIANRMRGIDDAPRVLPSALERVPTTAIPTLDAHGHTTAHITTLIPAHNEQAIIADALAALRAQTRVPDRIIVVADNCTDDTVAIARGLGVEVVETVGNTEKKAGALNFMLARILPEITAEDAVLIMDADTILGERFVESAAERLEKDAELIAVGGVFYGEEGFGLIGQLQRNEYVRYARHIGRRKGRVFVLSGTASIIRGYALRTVAESRGTLLPGRAGDVYDTVALTEDNELTLALKTLGAKMLAPQDCKTVTEVMPDWNALGRQRLRWQRGALENLGAYGMTRTTASYWGQQFGIAWGTIALNAYFVLLLVTIAAADEFAISTFWAVVGLIFMVERVVTVWDGGWRARLIAATLVIELVYSLFLQWIFIRSLFGIALRTDAGWNTVIRQSDTPTTEGAP
jgi:cellulose synthase/poly-beta-1,6-N-acetylglucosamine synthase-like glycosyltransferase